MSIAGVRCEMHIFEACPVFKTILSPLKFAASNNEQCNDSVRKECLQVVLGK